MIVRNVCKSPVRAVPRAQATFEAEALSYFARVEASGGSFDQTAINASYTPTYVKATINTLVRSLKNASLWTKLYEIHIPGATFAGALHKLKYVTTAQLTNTSFVSGDYAGAGANAGWSVGSNKFLTSDQLAASVGTANLHLFDYFTGSVADGVDFSMYGSQGASCRNFLRRVSTNTMTFYTDEATASNGLAFAKASFSGGFFLGTRSGANCAFYENGVSKATKSNASGNGTYTGESGYRSPALSSNAGRTVLRGLGSFLTSGEVSSFNTIVNAFCTSLGIPTF